MKKYNGVTCCTRDKTVSSLFLFLIILSSLSAVAQPEIRFENTSFDFGDTGHSPKAHFVFENTGSDRLAILMAKAENGVRVVFPKGYLSPGTVDTVYVFYEARNTGRINEEISLLTNADDDPVVLTITGNITDVLECPDFYGRNTSARMKAILVRDGETGDPVAGSNIKIVENKRKRFSGTTNYEGMFRKNFSNGQYDIEVIASGYRTERTSMRINESVGLVVIDLYPVPVPADYTDYPTEDSTERDPWINTKTTVFSDTLQVSDTGIEMENEEFPAGKYAPNNLVFLVDVSLSMRQHDRIGLLKEAMKNLVSALRDIDSVSLISFAGKATVLLTSISGAQKDALYSAIDSLSPWGNTYGIKGITAAYDLALKYYIQNGNNQIILATDGEFNSPDFSDRELEKLVRNNAGKGVSISIIGFGDEAQPVKRMQQIAETGNGSYLQFEEGANTSGLLIDEVKDKSLINKDNR
ncbi:MAG: VWA domain-containing protein [Bacteroidetes bacterium]|nr:VWA domain-containing protein [Bacteroidota bacterium]